jgi:hypothetical protein
MGLERVKEGFKVMNQKYDEDYIAELIEFAKGRISDWHKQKADYVFLNDTSAFPLGYVLKEAWREAYPNEKMPSFYRVNPAVMPGFRRHSMTFGPTGFSRKLSENPEYLKKIEEFFKSRIKKKDAKVVILDEQSTTRASVGAVENAIHNATGLPYENIILDDGGLRISTVLGFFPKFTKKDIGSMSHFEETEDLSTNQVNLRGRINKGDWGNRGYGQSMRPYIPPEEQKIKLLDYLHDLKLAGKLAGESVRQANHKQFLEKRVGATVAILGLIGSILFLSSNLTGNVIGKSTDSSIIGVILFLMGLAGAFFYFKRK